jgi:parallel beta-helix repeat protein
MVSENNAANGNRGVYLSDGSSGNIVSRNNIAHNDYGITVYICHNNTFAQNNITNNQEIGVSFYHCTNSTLLGNTIANNSGAGLDIVGHTDEHTSSYVGNNIFYHNNFIDNTPQVYVFYSSGNTWDNGYPSGGNYWSDFTGTDANVDGIGDTPYTIVDHSTSANYLDRYPLMNQWVQREHELATSLTAPASLTLGDSTSLKAIVANEGLKDEVNVELSLLINGTVAESESIPSLPSGHTYTLSYLWSPTAEGTFNVTAYAHSVPGEASLEDNQVTKFVTVAGSPAPPEVQAGVKAGDWIRIDYTISGASSGSPLPQWLKVEFLSVEGTTATVRVTMHMSDGTEQSETLNVDVVAGGQALGLSGFLIPANCATGDCIYMTGYGNVTIEGETTRTYAGASRAVVYASFSQLGTQLTYYWDKQTGVMVEASTTSGSITATGKATETNMWLADSSPFWMQWWFYALVAAIIVALAVTVYFIKRRKPPAPTAPPLPAEGT